MQTKLILLVTSIVICQTLCFGKGVQNLNSDTTGYSTYAGTYRYPEASPVPYINIVFKNGKLYASAEGFPETQLYRKEKDVFFDSTYGAEFAFIRTGNRVDTVKVDVNGAMLLGVRMKDESLLKTDLNINRCRTIVAAAGRTRYNYSTGPREIII